MADSEDMPAPRVKRQKYTINAWQLSQLHDKIDILQSQLGALISHIQTISNQTSPTALDSSSQRKTSTSITSASPSLAPPLDQRRTPAYLGPTSSTFGLDNAQAELERTQANKPTNSAEAGMTSPSTATDDGDEVIEHRLSLDFQVIKKAEASRLIDLFQETTGTVYPCVDIAAVRDHAMHFFDDGDQGQIFRRIYGLEESPNEFNRDLEILRTILAIGFVIDDSGKGDQGERLMLKVEDAMHQRFRIFEVDMKELLLLFLMSFYYFHRGDEVMAYRSTGLAVRGAIEMGLHRRSTWLRTSGNFPGDLERSWAIKLFWCIYAVDRRWSLGTGMPFGLQDADMDVELPELDETTPYLKCLVSYGRLASKIWRFVSDSEHGRRQADGEGASYLDFLVQEWSKSIPEDLQIQNISDSVHTTSESTIRALQTLLHLQANQMRILLHKPDLMFKQQPAKSAEITHPAVEIAQDSIHHIDSLNRTTDIYRRQRTTYDYFLVSAIAVLFLASCKSPRGLSEAARDDFQTALDLVKDFVGSSLSARRLWKTIRHLRHLGPHLNSNTKLAHTAQATVETSGGDSDQQNRMVADPTNSVTLDLEQWPDIGLQVYQELNDMFAANEGFSVTNPDPVGAASGTWATSASGVSYTPMMNGAYEDDIEFSRLLTDLF